MNRQEIFNRVARHLLKQGKKSMHDEKILYHSPSGLKCAIGVLIKRGVYTPLLEAKIVESFAVLNALGKSGVPITPSTITLLKDLQKCHDAAPPEEWQTRLDKIADWHNLKPLPVKK